MTDPALERDAIALFERLLDVAEPDRDAWLAAETADRPELLSRVEALRQADRSARMRTGAAVEDVDDEELPPERIGAYRIVGRIGRGGMGSVYRGERMTGDFAHVVAIKIIKPGLLSAALAERFRRERQTLASLAHPNIAQLHDGGDTDDGSPWFAMEYVDGLPLLDWGEQHRPDRAERQRLFADICAAVAFAHRNLIVHRDLTPSNVLVTAEGVVKLIDFGIARAADSDAAGADPSRPSISGLSLTPGYAAPERMTSSVVTTAADVYSLGKVLEKLIPPGSGDDELKAIIARATAPDPADRYATADALGADIAAWRSGRPVVAMGRLRFYPTRKFIGRHRLGVAAAATALLLLIGAFTLTAVAYTRAEAARQAEAARFEELRSLARYMIFELNGRMSRVVGNAEARLSLADRAQAYLSALATSPAADDMLKLEAAQGFIALARIQGVPTGPNLGQPDQARFNLATAVRMLQRSELPAARTAPELADAFILFASLRGHTDADGDGAGRSLAAAEHVLESVPAGERTDRWRQARRRLRHGQADHAIISQDATALAAVIARLGQETADASEAARRSRDHQLDLALLDYYQGVRGYFTDELDPAVDALVRAERRLVAIDRALPNDPATLFALAWNEYVGFGAATGLLGRAAEARRFLETADATLRRLLAIEPNDNSLRSFSGNVRGVQSQAMSAAGDHAAAIALQREVIALHEAALGPTRRAVNLNRLATAQVTMGGIARTAADRDLACASYSAARAHIAELERRDELLGHVASHKANLDRNIALCASGAPVAQLVVFR